MPPLKQRKAGVLPSTRQALIAIFRAGLGEHGLPLTLLPLFERLEHSGMSKPRMRKELKRIKEWIRLANLEIKKTKVECAQNRNRHSILTKKLNRLKESLTALHESRMPEGSERSLRILGSMTVLLKEMKQKNVDYAELLNRDRILYTQAQAKQIDHTQMILRKENGSIENQLETIKTIQREAVGD